MSAWRSWVALWSRRETAESLALVRILLPAVVLWDLYQVHRLALVDVLWATVEEGGLGPASRAEPLIWFYERYGSTLSSTHWLYGLTIASALTLMLGLFSRTSAPAFLLFYAQLEALSPDADRGIDTLLRDVSCILVFARAGATMSLDALLRRQRLLTDTLVPAWPRYLIIAQLIILYFFAGLAKDAASWSLHGGYVALFYVLHEPHHVRFVIPHEALVLAYPLTQLGTLTTVIWERCAILLPLLIWLRNTRERDTRWQRWANKLHLLELWVGMGIFFHLMLALLLALGIFPWGCLALYPALAKPETWRRWASKLRPRLASRRSLRHDRGSVRRSPPAIAIAFALAACHSSSGPAGDPGDASFARDTGTPEDPTVDPLAACAALELAEPRTIDDVVTRIDALPAATIECLVASLPRPLSLVASLSATSLQPAANSNTPRIFVLYDGLLMSVVGGGDGAHRIEFGQWVTETRTLKAEIRYPIARPLAREAPYQGLVDVGQTVSSCGFCHNQEEPHPTIAGAFVSDALAPAGLFELSVADVRAIRAGCTDEPYCAILRALFDYGDVRQGTFPAEVRRGF